MRSKGTYNFIFLLSVEGRGPLSLGRCRSFGLGLGPACRTLVGGTPRFRNTEEEEEAIQGKGGTVTQIIYKLHTQFCVKDYVCVGSELFMPSNMNEMRLSRRLF